MKIENKWLTSVEQVPFFSTSHALQFIQHQGLSSYQYPMVSYAIEDSFCGHFTTNVPRWFCVPRIWTIFITKYTKIGKADFYSDHNLSYYTSRIVVHFSLVECVVATKIKREDWKCKCKKKVFDKISHGKNTMSNEYFGVFCITWSFFNQRDYICHASII